VAGEGKDEGRPREYIHTHMNVHEDKKGDSTKGEEEMKLPLLIPGLSDVKCCGHLFITNNNQEVLY
jgi:hypothetical protein